LDEPAAGLSDGEAGDLIASVSELRERGLTILLVEHNLRLVRELADHVVVLDRGIVIATGTTTAIGNDPKVREAYLGSHEL
jgi:ABC-type branched-subunit amino acid transport system ATPase component